MNLYDCYCSYNHYALGGMNVVVSWRIQRHIKKSMSHREWTKTLYKFKTVYQNETIYYEPLFKLTI
jgi:hypothetical protein